MGTIGLEIEEMCAWIKNPWGVEYSDYLKKISLSVKTGKIYGIISEYMEGGDTISALLSNQIPWERGKAYLDDIEVPLARIQEMGWYIGKSVYSKGIFHREISMRKALNHAIKDYGRYTKLDDIIEDFGLSEDRLNMKLRMYSYEKFRVSMALGYACKKTFFCFPWMSSSFFYNWILNSSVYRFFRQMRGEGCTFILPTSRRINVEGFVDEIIELRPEPSYTQIIAEHPDFKKYFSHFV